MRNRALLIEVAARALERDGADATVHAIADEAGLGIGTLYRHFSTRESLIESVFRSELERLCDATPFLLGHLPPDDAVRTWMGYFLDYAHERPGMRDVVHSIVSSEDVSFRGSRTKLVDTLAGLLSTGVNAGVIRPDTDPFDVLVGLSGIALVAGKGQQREQADRILDLIVNGLRAERADEATLLSPSAETLP